jgi:hypothetical protein
VTASFPLQCFSPIERCASTATEEPAATAIDQSTDFLQLIGELLDELPVSPDAIQPDVPVASAPSSKPSRPSAEEIPEPDEPPTSVASPYTMLSVWQPTSVPLTMLLGGISEGPSLELANPPAEPIQPIDAAIQAEELETVLQPPASFPTVASDEAPPVDKPAPAQTLAPATEPAPCFLVLPPRSEERPQNGAAPSTSKRASLTFHHEHVEFERPQNPPDSVTAADIGLRTKSPALAPEPAPSGIPGRAPTAPQIPAARPVAPVVPAPPVPIADEAEPVVQSKQPRPVEPSAPEPVRKKELLPSDGTQSGEPVRPQPVGAAHEHSENRAPSAQPPVPNHARPDASRTVQDVEHPAASTAGEDRAEPAEEPQPGSAARPVAQLSLRVSPPGRPSVHVRLFEKPEGIQVRLLARDDSTAEVIRRDLPSLMKALDRQGFVAADPMPNSLTAAEELRDQTDARFSPRETASRDTADSSPRDGRRHSGGSQDDAQSESKEAAHAESKSASRFQSLMSAVTISSFLPSGDSPQ